MVTSWADNRHVKNSLNHILLICINLHFLNGFGNSSFLHSVVVDPQSLASNLDCSEGGQQNLEQSLPLGLQGVTVPLTVIDKETGSPWFAHMKPFIDTQS